MRSALLASVALTACAAAPADGGFESVSDAAVDCSVTGKPLEAVGAEEVCGIFRNVLADRLADRWPRLSVVIDVRTPYLAQIAVSDADGGKLLERDLSITDASLNGHAFEAMAKSMAAELSAGVSH